MYHFAIKRPSSLSNNSCRIFHCNMKQITIIFLFCLCNWFAIWSSSPYMPTISLKSCINIIFCLFRCISDTRHIDPWQRLMKVIISCILNSNTTGIDIWLSGRENSNSIISYKERDKFCCKQTEQNLSLFVQITYLICKIL